LFYSLSGVILNRVAQAGSGSSIDHLTYDNRAQEMKVMERWKIPYQDDNCPKLLKIMENKEVRKLSIEIFSSIPDGL